MCTINALLELVSHCSKDRVSVVPAYVNSDVIENHFSMVRSLFNGASEHPTYYVYKSLQNSVILTQPPGLPKKRNACNSYIQPPPACKVKKRT